MSINTKCWLRFSRRRWQPIIFPRWIKKKKIWHLIVHIEILRPIGSIIFKKDFHTTKRSLIKIMLRWFCRDTFSFNTIDLPYIIILIKYTLGLYRVTFFIESNMFSYRQSSCYTPARTGWTERTDTLNATAPSLHCVSAS